MRVCGVHLGNKSCVSEVEGLVWVIGNYIVHPTHKVVAVDVSVKPLVDGLQLG